MSFDSSHFIAAAAVVSTLLAKRPQEEHVEELRFAQATLAFIQTRLVEASAENIRAADARATAAEELARTADARATIAQAVAQEARIASARDDERARAAEARATAAEELARAADARASASDSTLLELRTAQAVGDRSFTSPRSLIARSFLDFASWHFSCANIY